MRSVPSDFFHSLLRLYDTAMFLFIDVVCFHYGIIQHCMNILTFIHSTIGKSALFQFGAITLHPNATMYILPEVFGSHMYVASVVIPSTSGDCHFLALWPNFQLPTL